MVCRHDKTRQRRIRHCAQNGGCGENALSAIRMSVFCRHDKTRQRRIRHCVQSGG
ncbi:hypothetical protein EcE24377A_2962 [Escherichia coli O139:H28 str. E24377A]|uniref:Uncharacterized protein n=1 Tax=Escherichia coli O139:H28 (strain E24377A / ETEC) TaxID=331111 RepID=A7ZQB2_ECO24|nr:hypothetical protein EcE24377A_2962 [Escherichia coli O139:H28 str. E24377A]